MKNLIQERFAEQFGGTAAQYASAGRVNLIGEHVDFCGGFVFPGAIDCGVIAQVRPNGTDQVNAYSLHYDQLLSFGLEEEDLPHAHWARYLFGVCREMIKRGARIGGFDTVFDGNVPAGAGLSSSAALESTFAFALNDLFGCGFTKFDLALIGQATEHNYVGVKCGIMDQFASMFGRKDSLILLNCRTLEHKYYPFHPQGYRLVLLDTCVKHELASSAYNRRRASVEAAAEAIRKRHPEVEYLADAKRVWLEEVKDEISAEDFLRAQYILGEVQRVLDVCNALTRDDYGMVGELMYQTHFGLSRMYEVSCPELDFLATLARRMEVTGARMMGGGYGGCTINLVQEELYAPFVERAKKEFATAFGHEPKVYDVVISDGARKL
ncbi:MAG: galactokinase [Bacteroidales bacterium]|nr:galactokinase [Bacteroidales bacterium]